MQKKTNSSRSKENGSSVYKKIIIGSLSGTVIFFILLFLFSCIALKSDVFPMSAYMPLGLVSAAISSLGGGFITVRPDKKNGMLLGALTGLVQALVSSAAMFFINERNSGTGIFILMAVIILFGAIGGMAAVNLKVRKKYR